MLQCDSAIGAFLPLEGAHMSETERYNDEPNVDPPARFATDAEIELADALRRRLEERYLAQSAPLQTSPGERD